MKRIFSVVITLCFFQLANAQTDDEFYKLAKQKYDEKDYQYANLLIDKAIALNDTNIEYWLTKAVIQQELDNPTREIDYIRKAISLDSLNAIPYDYAGSYYAYRRFGQKDSAMLMYDLAIKYAKSDTDKYRALANRGTAKTSYRDFKGAIEDLETVLAFNPNDIAALNNIANGYKDVGDTSKAILTMKKLISIDKDFVGSYINLGLLYVEADSLDSAILYFDKALLISPDIPHIYSNRGFTYYKMGKYQQALNDVNKSLSIYPTNSYAYKYLALIYFAMNLKNEGCTALYYASYYGYKENYGNEVDELREKNCPKETDETNDTKRKK